MKFKAKVWLYQGDGGWHFVSLPKKLSKDIKKVFSDMAKPFGSLKVKAKIGATIWESSLFPDNKRNCYLLPIKKEIRKKEKIRENDMVQISLTFDEGILP